MFDIIHRITFACCLVSLAATMCLPASAQRPRAGGFFDRMRQPRQPSTGNDNANTPVRPVGPSLDRIDSDGDGEITLEEFRQLGDTISRLKAENVSGFIFSSLDIDNDGTLSRTEFTKLTRYGRNPAQNDRLHNPVAGKPGKNPLRTLVIGGEIDQVKPTWSDEQLAFFDQKIQPLMTAKCFGCHSEAAGQVKGGLRMDTYDHLRRGGASGEAISDDPSDSLIVMALRGDGMALMPPDEPLDERAISDFETWISMGAPDSRPIEPVRAAEPTPASTIDIEAGREHWAFRPIVDPGVDPGKDPSGSVENQIDRLIADARNRHQLSPVASASRETLVRRITLDLIGLPPTPAEVAAFVNDPASDDVAFGKVVDRLLESERFGEHWSRHWLDVARYAESSGKEVNLFYPFAWRYRDYVIHAFNEDKPYNEFLTEQLAGDLLPASSDNDRAEKIIATGYLAVGTKSHQESDARQFLLDVADEQIDAMSQGIMGLTISCARCHDHKFDPISQQEYYSLAGIFASSETLFGGVRTVQTNRTTGYALLPRSSDVPTGESMSARERQSLERQLQFLGQQSSGPSNPITLIRTATIKAKLSLHEADGTPKKLAMCVRDGQPMDIPVFLRGELDRPAGVAPRGFPSVIVGPDSPPITEASGRKELADWLTDPRHPLTSRVMANRVWMHLMGAGIVSTPDNFGTTGSAPSHPELLDHLASSLIDGGWSIKSLIRQIVLTDTYRLSTEADPSNTAIDVDNRYWWRQNRKRLTAEQIRDSVLLVSGSLDVTPPEGSPVQSFGEGQTRILDRDAGGTASTRNRQAADQGMRTRQRGMFGGGQRLGGQRGGRMFGGGMFGGGMTGGGTASGGMVPTLEHQSNVRSVYLPIIRDRIDPMLDAFDFPDASLVTGQRDTTIIASQSLFFLNDHFVQDQADAMAKRLEDATGDTTDDAIEQAYMIALQRPARPSERQMIETYLSEATGSRNEAWSVICQTLMATAEFRFCP